MLFIHLTQTPVVDRFAYPFTSPLFLNAQSFIYHLISWMHDIPSSTSFLGCTTFHPFFTWNTQTITHHHGTGSDWTSGGLYNFPENWRGTGRWKVSNKIQQLLNTLKRPKKRPLPEFYVDDEEDLEIAANPKDPNAPKPEGMIMTPAKGETLVVSLYYL